MGSIGPRNPLPMHLGGSPSPTEAVWRALRKAIGTTYSGKSAAGPIDGIEDSWRLAKARAVARVGQLDELAALQAFPDRATCHLPVYEEALAMTVSGTDQERRQACTAAFVAQVDGVAQHVRDGLRRITTAVDVEVTTGDLATVTQFGRFMDSRTAPTWASPGASWPGYSCHAVLCVSWTGDPTAELLSQVEGFLNTSLPAWVDYVVGRTDHGGFSCSRGALGLDVFE